MAAMGNLGASSSSSSSSGAPSWRYNVFLSFYGEDTRKGFTDHLYAALKRKRIITFRDDEKLERGKYISQELLKAIQNSQYAVVVISKRYAFSKWCLNELINILECRTKNGMIVLPVFYHVDPSNVRKQEGSFAEAFAKHSQNTEVDGEERQTWRTALEDVGNLSGCHIDDRHEAAIIEDISQKILDGVNRTPSKMYEGLVGIGSRASELISLLSMGSNDVHFVGVCGMGGIGKTTLAKVIYDQVSSQFEASVFIAHIREKTQNHGLVHLQTQLVWEILQDSKIKVWDTYTGIDLIKKIICDRNVFIVLDDVDTEDQLKALAGSHAWFGQGSRIIVTSRDYHLLSLKVDMIYNISELTDDESLELFCWKAFNNDHPKENYEKLSKDIVSYAEGLPLAIEVFGSYLFGRRIEAWKEAREQLKVNVNRDIINKLQISFDGLEKSQKELFLDIACLCNGKYDQQILECLDHHLIIDIDVLSDRCLIKKFKGRFVMHDLLRKMGQQIAHCAFANKLGKCRRLWNLEDIVHILNNKTGTSAVEGIILRPMFSTMEDQGIISKLPLPKVKLCLEGFSKMKNLKILICDDYPSYRQSHTLHWYGDFSNFSLSNELRYLQFVGYPLQSLPISFEAENLVVLKMPHSCITHMDGLKEFDKLTYIDMSFSHNLIEMPNFSKAPNLKQLDLQHCTKLSNLHSSIGFLKWLERLDLESCHSLTNLPEEISLESLSYLNLAGCSRITKFPNIVGNMTSLEFLDLIGTGITKLPLSFQNLTSIELLKLCGSLRYRSGVKKVDNRYSAGGRFFSSFQTSVSKVCISGGYIKAIDNEGRVIGLNSSGLQLPNFFLGFSSLKVLDLSFLNLSDEDIPTNFSYLSSIELLMLSGNEFTTIPIGVFELPNLNELCLGFCTKLHILPEAFLSRFSLLRKLNLGYCNLLDEMIPKCLGCLPSLEVLSLAGNRFRRIPNLVHLSSLSTLYLIDCTQLQVLPKLPLSLKSLWLHDSVLLDFVHVFGELINGCTSLAIDIDHDGRPCKVLKQLSCPHDFHLQPAVKFFEAYKIMGSALISDEALKWFNQRISNSFGIMECCFRWLNKGWHGIALLVIYRVHELGTFKGERKKQKLDEHGGSNYKIFDSNNDALPHFFCHFVENELRRKINLPLCALEVPSAGRNAFWVYLPYGWFTAHLELYDTGFSGKDNYHKDPRSKEWYDGDILKKGCLDASFESCYLNVEVECRAREVYKNDLSELSKVISDISPQGLDCETFQKFFNPVLKVSGLFHNPVRPCQ